MKTRNPDANCGNCPYWSRKFPNDDNGYCSRFPPPYTAINDGTMIEEYAEEMRQCYAWAHPVVFEKDFCGEHPDFWMEHNGMLDKPRELRFNGQSEEEFIQELRKCGYKVSTDPMKEPE